MVGSDRHTALSCWRFDWGTLHQGYDNVTINYCQDHGIVYEGYGAMRGCPFESPVVKQIALAHNASVAQVCIR